MKVLVPYQQASIKDTKTEKWTKGTVTGFTDSTITIDGFRFNFSDVSAVRFGRNGWKFLGSSFKAGGAVFGGIVLVNGLINNDSFDQMSGPLIVAAGMYGSGWLFDWISRRPYKLEKFRIEHVVID